MWSALEGILRSLYFVLQVSILRDSLFPGNKMVRFALSKDFKILFCLQ